MNFPLSSNFARGAATAAYLFKKAGGLAVFCVLGLSPATVSAAAANYADVYLFAGQSNMWGTGNAAADLPPELTGVQKDVMNFKNTPSVPKEGWYPLENGKNNNHTGEAWGLEAQLMPALAAVADSKPIYMLKDSLGGAALAKKEMERDWSVDSQGELLDGFLKSIQKVKASLEAEGKTPRFKGFIWMQGEAECCHAKADAENYQAMLEALIAKVRETAGAPDMPVYLGRIHRQYAQPHLQIVRARQARAAATGKNIFLFDTDSAPLHGDKIHFNGAGQVANGKTLFDLITGKAKQVPAKIVPGQAFSIREYAGPGTLVGKIALSQAGLPTPTFTLESEAFEVNGETGEIKVRDLSGIKSFANALKVPVSAVNGARPTPAEAVTVNFQAAADDKIAGLYAVMDPADAGSSLVVEGGYEEIRDLSDPSRKYKAPDAARRPLQEAFPGTAKQAPRFAGKQIMMGPASNEFLEPGKDEDFTIAAAVHVPAHSLSSEGWCLMINKGVEPALGIGYNYAQNQFFFVYSNPSNGTVQRVMADKETAPGASHVVRMRKAGETCRLYIDGALAGEQRGKARPAILTPGQGAAIGMGGAFPPNPSFAGFLGKFYLVKGIPTTREEERIDRDLAEWGGIK
ncbi:MAG TPA: sialate O-acetylesterase [Chthoniobacterales bacterium]